MVHRNSLCVPRSLVDEVHQVCREMALYKTTRLKPPPLLIRSRDPRLKTACAEYTASAFAEAGLPGFDGSVLDLTLDGSKSSLSTAEKLVIQAIYGGVSNACPKLAAVTLETERTDYEPFDPELWQEAILFLRELCEQTAVLLFAEGEDPNGVLSDLSDAISFLKQVPVNRRHTPTQLSAMACEYIADHGLHIADEPLFCRSFAAAAAANDFTEKQVFQLCDILMRCTALSEFGASVSTDTLKKVFPE